MGLERGIVRDKVIKDVQSIDNIPKGKPMNRVINVSGNKLQYTVYRRQSNGNDIYNIGRIHKTE